MIGPSTRALRNAATPASSLASAAAWTVLAVTRTVSKIWPVGMRATWPLRGSPHSALACAGLEWAEASQSETDAPLLWAAWSITT